MKRKIRRNKLYCILAAALLLCGCRNGGSPAGSTMPGDMEQESITYVAQTFPLPEYDSFDGACSHDNDLYYAAAGLDPASQEYQTAFYVLKQNESEPEKLFSLAQNQRVQRMSMDAEGNLYYLGYEEAAPKEDAVAGEDTVAGITEVTLYKLDQSGNPVLTQDLSEYTKGQTQSRIQDLAVDAQNHIVLCSSDQKIFVLNPDGSIAFETRADGSIYDIFGSGEKVFVAHSSIDGMEIREIDVAGKKLSSKLPLNIPGSQFYIEAGENETFLIATETSVYKYDQETGKTVKKFDWQTYDATEIKFGMLLPLENNSFLTISRDYSTFPMEIDATLFREAAEGETVLPEKSIITLGIDYPLSNAIKKEIVAFNKSNPDYRIEIKDYKEDRDRLNTEIITGEGPDLLVLLSDSANLLADKGALVDLKPYFEKDESFQREDFLENILNAFETDGQLYSIPVSFNVRTLVCKQSLLGDKTSWNLDELIAFAESQPENTSIFDNASKSGVLSLLKYAYTDQLVNTDTPDSPVDRNLLIKMLEFSNRYEDDSLYVYDSDLGGKAASGQLLLLDDTVRDGVAYRAFSGLFNEPVTFIGYPTEKGNGNLIYSDKTFAINSSSEYKDTCWQFISTLLSKDVQIEIAKEASLWSCFPVRKDVMETYLGYAMEWEWNDFIRDGQYIFRRGDSATAEEVEPVRRLVENIDTAVHISPDINQIIEEEAAVYFSGTKPVEEVVDVIENRIKTYVNESK